MSLPSILAAAKLFYHVIRTNKLCAAQKGNKIMKTEKIAEHTKTTLSFTEQQ